MTESAPPERMDHHIRMRIRTAAFRATRVFPGAVGQMISRELMGFEEFGWRLAMDSIVMRVVDDVMNADLPVVVSSPKAQELHT